MTSTDTSSNEAGAQTTPRCGNSTSGGRVFAGVLIAAWLGALAVTSAPDAGAGRPDRVSQVPPRSVDTVVSTTAVSTTAPPLSSGQHTTAY